MQAIIDDLKDLPGVLGACLYHGQRGPLETNLPAIFTADKLVKISKLLMKIHAAGRMNFQDLTDLSLQYDESVILVRELEDNLIIFTLCDPGFNQNLVTMSLNLLQQELKNQPFQVGDSPSVTADPPPVTDVSTGPSEEVSRAMEAMKSHLPKIMGPMADIIFDEAVETWKKQGKYTVGDLDLLVQMLAEEIENADKITNYKEMIKPALQQAAKGG